jgi:hypothetical protein
LVVRIVPLAVAAGLLVAGCTGVGNAAGGFSRSAPVAAGSSRFVAQHPAPSQKSPSAPVLAAQMSINGLEVRYPSSWLSFPQYAYTFSFDSLWTVQSIQPLHNPCTHHGTETQCGGPKDHLHPGSFIVEWTQYSLMPGPTRDFWAGVKGVPTKVAGLPARLNIEAATGWCAKLGGAKQLTATIAYAEHTVMTACMADPAAAATEKIMRAVLASASLKA